MKEGNGSALCVRNVFEAAVAVGQLVRGCDRGCGAWDEGLLHASSLHASPPILKQYVLDCGRLGL